MLNQSGLLMSEKTLFIPKNLFLLIFSNLDVKDVLKCSLVCKKWKNYVNNESLWNKLLERDWNNLTREIDSHPQGIDSIIMGDQYAKSKYVVMLENKRNRLKGDDFQNILSCEALSESSSFLTQNISSSLTDLNTEVYCSAGTCDINSYETLNYDLKDICLVEYIIINFSRDSKYLPREVIIQLGFSTSCFHFSSLPVSVTNDERVFLSFFPFNSVGRYVRVYLLGRKSCVDGNNYMTSFNNINFFGTNLSHLLEYNQVNNSNIEKRSNENDLSFLNILYNYHLEKKDQENLKKYLFNLIRSNEEIVRYYFKHKPLERKISFVCNEYAEISSLKENHFSHKNKEDENLILDDDLDSWGYTKVSHIYADLPMMGHHISLFYPNEVDEKTKNPNIKSIYFLPTPVSLDENFPSLRSFSNLTILNLFGLGLRELPEGVCEMKSLVILNVIGNNFSSLPKEIGELVNLKELLLGDNIYGTKNLGTHKLVTFPESFGNLRKLEKLWAQKCGLTKLPFSIRRLSNLKQLLLHGNQLTVTREILSNFRKLKYFTHGIINDRYEIFTY